MIMSDYRKIKYPNDIYHYGIPRRSGRYPWGSGERPYQRTKVAGDYKLSKYQSAPGYWAKTLFKTVGSYVLGVTVPGYCIMSSAKYMFDVTKGLDLTEDYSKKDGEVETVSNLKRKNEHTSLEEDATEVNPGSGKKGTVKNCVNCAIAMEMRRRGYDVQARRTSTGSSLVEFRNAFKDPDIVSDKYPPVEGESRRKRAQRAYNDVMNKLEQYGEGSRGSLIVEFSKFTGVNASHALSWEVRDGRTIISDPQVGKIGKDIANTFAIAEPNEYIHVRLDNLEVSEDITKNVVSKKER